MRLKFECWKRVMAGHLKMRANNGANFGLNKQATKLANGQVVEMIGRPHLNRFLTRQARAARNLHQLPAGLPMAANIFVIQSRYNDDVQYRLVIKTVKLIMRNT